MTVKSSRDLATRVTDVRLTANRKRGVCGQPRFGVVMRGGSVSWGLFSRSIPWDPPERRPR